MVRNTPQSADDRPVEGDRRGYLFTEKQARFKDTVVACVATGEVTFPQWRLAHFKRCNERLSTTEWTAWNVEPAFVSWFFEDVAWDVTDGDKKMLDTHYYQALAKKLRDGNDTKALELYAKESKKVGEHAESQGGGLVVLLNWAKGNGAVAEPRQVVDTTATPVPPDEDPWGGARVERK